MKEQRDFEYKALGEEYFQKVEEPGNRISAREGSSEVI